MLFSERSERDHSDIEAAKRLTKNILTCSSFRSSARLLNRNPGTFKPEYRRSLVKVHIKISICCLFYSF